MTDFPTISTSRRLKVLLIAYACEPNRGSEPGTGWNVAMGLATDHDVTVATRANNRTEIERYLIGHQGSVPSFLYIDPPPWVLRLKKSGVIPVPVFYAWWQWSLARVLKDKADGSYDILHQLTFNSFEVPPLVFLRSKAVKIWGPVGGGQTVAIGMLSAFGFYGAVKEWLRNMRVRMSAQTPLCRKVLKGCSLVLFANEETRRLMGQSCACETDLMIDVGVDVERFAPGPARADHSGKTILVAGRLESRKGVVLLLKAFGEVARGRRDLELRIIGDGPIRSDLVNYVSRQEYGQHVVFTGEIGHDEMSGEFSRADIFAFPSLRDTSGSVVLEAMAMQLPVVCFDHQGAAIMVGAGCGVKVPAIRRSEAVVRLQETLTQLVEQGELSHAMGEAGRQRVRILYNWQVKVEQISGYYKRFALARDKADD